ncbi:MAG: PAS domain-containing sensor histidine kinase [Candidatus Cloacimonadaceae bacterium]
MSDIKKTSHKNSNYSTISNIALWSKILIDNVNDIVGISDREGKLLYISSSVKKILGWSERETINFHGTDFAHKDDIPIIMTALDQLIKKKEVTFEYRCLTKSGEYIWLENSVKLVTNPIDKEEYRIFIARDIQQRKEMEEQLAATAAELSKSNQMKDKLLTLVAHDLQNPIYSVITLSNFIKNKLDTINKQELLDFISQINETAQNSFVLLENLILLDKVNRKDVTLNPENIKVKKLISDNLNLLKNQISHKEIDIDFEIPDDLYLNADFYIFDTIIKNILSNAVKYTHSKGLIAISATRDNGNVVIVIKDTGIGMSKEQQKYIFEVDTRKRLNTLSTAHGSGLGLIICNELIAQQGGSIAIESNIKKGSKFTITFPQYIKKNPA